MKAEHGSTDQVKHGQHVGVVTQKAEQPVVVIAFHLNLNWIFHLFSHNSPLSTLLTTLTAFHLFLWAFPFIRLNNPEQPLQLSLDQSFWSVIRPMTSTTASLSNCHPLRYKRFILLLAKARYPNCYKSLHTNAPHPHRQIIIKPINVIWLIPGINTNKRKLLNSFQYSLNCHFTQKNRNENSFNILATRIKKGSEVSPLVLLKGMKFADYHLTSS